MAQLIVITNPGLAPGFQLAGVETYAAETPEEARQRLVERLEAEGLTFAAGHFPPPGFGRIVWLESRRHWQAL